jgi:hypothetical protein
VHGLNPSGSATHAWDTWRTPQARQATCGYEINYQRIYLMLEFFYEYNASPAFKSGKDRFIFHANDFLESLNNERDDVSSI